MVKGKKLENDVKKYLKMNGDFYHKFTDSFGARGLTTPVPADFIIFPPHGRAILLECKMTQKIKVPMASFRPSQWKAAKQSLEVESCNYYVIINHNGGYNNPHNGYYLIHALEILKSLDNGEKSIDLTNLAKSDTINKVMDFMFGENSE